MSHSLQCVHCKSVLKSATPVPTGKAVKCPKCQHTFLVGAATAEAGFSIQCVHCSAVLKSPAPIGPGKKVTCPKCTKSFTTPAPSPAPALAKSPASTPASLNVSIFTGDTDAAIAGLMGGAGAKPPEPIKDDLDDLVCEDEDEVEAPKREDAGVLDFAEEPAKDAPKKKNTW